MRAVTARAAERDPEPGSTRDKNAIRTIPSTQYIHRLPARMRSQPKWSRHQATTEELESSPSPNFPLIFAV